MFHTNFKIDYNTEYLYVFLLNIIFYVNVIKWKKNSYYKNNNIQIKYRYLMSINIMSLSINLHEINGKYN